MFKYIKDSIARKKARRTTQKYSHTVERFQLEKEGTIEFANWNNPLGIHKTITQQEIDFYRTFARPGSFCIDIGANIGDTTVPMGLAVGSTGLTLAFEPNPMVFDVLQANILLNKGKVNIVAVPYAVTEENGEFYYSSSEASFGNGGVSVNSEEAQKHGKFQLKNKVTGVNLLSYLNEHYQDELSRLTFIKIDVEGFDKEVIKSIGPLIQQYRPVLIAEVFDHSTVEDRLELFSVVADHNYTLYYFYDFQDHTEIWKLQKDEMITRKNFNFYAVPTEAEDNYVFPFATGRSR